jgi:hypothetical protein
MRLRVFLRGLLILASIGCSDPTGPASDPTSSGQEPSTKPSSLDCDTSYIAVDAWEPDGTHKGRLLRRIACQDTTIIECVLGCEEG